MRTISLRTCLLRAAMLAAAGLLFAGPAWGQEENGRSLNWPEVRVEARLDDDGRLHVREHQSILFDGSWNGGERELDARLGQAVRLERMARVDRTTGELLPLAEDDDLEEVDQYDIDGSTVRWRSRLPDDPPFDRERIDYVLEYTLSNAVLAVEDGYMLDHDFLFSDRDGPVDRFFLALVLDPAWAAPADFTGSWEAVAIPPGRGFAVQLPLQRTAATIPATVLEPPPGLLRTLLIALLAGGTAMLFLRFLRREREDGRYEQLPAVVDEEWLRAHVLRLPPEVVGAAWDRATGSAEVAGLLARLVQEGKLSSRTETDAETSDGEPVLHLELEVPRDAFQEHERELIDALFFDDRTRTDTQTIKDHYKESGFNPVSTISPALEARVDALAGGGKVSQSWRAVVAGFAIGTVLLITAAILRNADTLPGVIALVAIFILGSLALAVASTYAQRVTHLRGLLIAVAVPALLMVAGLVAFIGGALETATPSGSSGLSPYYHPGPLLLVALVVLGLTMAAAVLKTARPSDTAARLALRRKLAAAEAYFRAELDRPDPALRDEWFPYILAFGLGTHVDRWFSAYGPASDSVGTRTAVVAAAASAGSGRGSGGSTWTGGGAAFGGGGGFSGGGVGGSWGAAAGTIASGVSSPSSGGTSGGVASSGGGGGGGW